MSPSDAKTYAISVKGTTGKYDPSTSFVTASFNIKVDCVPTKLTPGTKTSGTKTGSHSFTLGSTTPLVISYSAFTLVPACKGTSVQYSASLVSGEALPSYVMFDQAKNQLTLTDEGSLSEGTINIAITGTISVP
jgi:hypothetical protein